MLLLIKLQSIIPPSNKHQSTSPGTVFDQLIPFTSVSGATNKSRCDNMRVLTGHEAVARDFKKVTEAGKMYLQKSTPHNFPQVKLIIYIYIYFTCGKL